MNGRLQGGSGDGRPVAHVQLLGAVRVIRATGERVELPSPSQRRLVALLAIHAGVSLRGQQLCELLGIQSGALRATVSRVRRLVGDDVLHTDAVGYRIEASSDLSTFAEAVAGAFAARGIDAYDAALRLWQGPALDEFAGEAWAEATVARFDELRLVAVEGRASELVSAGRLGEAAAELMMHVADHPLRDRAQGLLMLALAAQGRQAEALRTFESYRRHLVDQVGTVPSPEVRELDRWIADGSASLPVGWPTPGRPVGSEARDPSGSAPTTVAFDTESPAAPALRSSGIPTFRSSFVGRDRELTGVLTAVRSGRSVTLVGEGGVGKTRLSACVAEHLVVDGPLWFVELAPVSDAGDLVGTVAAQLGASLVTGQRGIEAFINDRAAVLVLDNCEHLVDAVAEFVDTLLGACPALVVLATSREPLGIVGERVYRVPPLDPSGEAADLFVSRAEAAGAVVRPDQRDEVESVCRRLDGNPLAIELAAPRAAALGLRTIIDGLDDRFVLLSGGRRRGDERHQTLRAVVEWSDRLLTPVERATFRTLGVFSGGFELDAANHVLHTVGLGDEPVLPTLASLVQRSMVVAEAGDLGTRFRLLDTLRAYSLEQLRDADEFESVSAAHAAWVASITDEPLERWMTRDGHHRSLRLEREVDNWRDAMAYAARAADPSLVHRLCGAPMGLFLWGRPDLVDHAETLDALLADRIAERAADDAADGVEADSSDRAARAAVAYGRWGSAWLGLDLVSLTDACDRFDRLVPDDVTGIAATMRSATLLAGGDMAAATAVRTGALDDPRLVPGGRDLTAAITVYGACSAGLRGLLADEWTHSVGELARSSDVAAIRKLARVAISWLLVDADPAGSVTALHEALADPEPIPAYWDRIIETFASRFLMQVSPVRAAQHLLEVLPGFGAGLAAADAVALVTSAGLLAVSGHPATDDVVATLAVTTSASYLATVVRDVADRRSTGRLLGSDQIVPVVRAALEDIAGGAGSTADAQV